MTENTHSLYHLLLLSSLVDLAYLVQNQLQESTLSCCVVVCVHANVFTGLLHL